MPLDGRRRDFRRRDLRRLEPETGDVVSTRACSTLRFPVALRDGWPRDRVLECGPRVAASRGLFHTTLLLTTPTEVLRGPVAVLHLHGPRQTVLAARARPRPIHRAVPAGASLSLSGPKGVSFSRASHARKRASYNKTFAALASE